MRTRSRAAMTQSGRARQGGMTTRTPPPRWCPLPVGLLRLMRSPRARLARGAFLARKCCLCLAERARRGLKGTGYPALGTCPLGCERLLQAHRPEGGAPEAALDGEVEPHRHEPAPPGLPEIEQGGHADAGAGDSVGGRPGSASARMVTAADS